MCCEQDVKKEPMFCMETAVKLLTFSWIVYSDTTPPAKEKEVHINVSDSEIDQPHEAAQVAEVKHVAQVSATGPHLSFCICCWHRALMLVAEKQQ